MNHEETKLKGYAMVSISVVIPVYNRVRNMRQDYAKAIEKVLLPELLAANDENWMLTYIALRSANQLAYPIVKLG